MTNAQQVDNGVHGAFKRIKPLRAHEYVAEQMRRHIALGIIASGEAFPPERELAEMFGVGRATVQHAVRLLEADRLVETRRGRNGGTFVVGVNRDGIARRRLLLELEESKKECEDALVYRRTVEIAVVQLAAKNARKADIQAIAEANEAMRGAQTEDEYHRHDTEFHVRIAQASGNAVLIEAVEQARLLLNNAILAQPETDLWHERIDAEHDELLAAIRARDPERAAAAMSTHLAHTEQGIRAMLKSLR